MLSDGSTYEKLHLIKGPTEEFEKAPRGIMVMVENQKFWEFADKCFVSIPAGVLGKNELWFSEY